MQLDPWSTNGVWPDGQGLEMYPGMHELYCIGYRYSGFKPSLQDSVVKTAWGLDVQ